MCTSTPTPEVGEIWKMKSGSRSDLVKVVSMSGTDSLFPVVVQMTESPYACFSVNIETLVTKGGCFRLSPLPAPPREVWAIFRKNESGSLFHTASTQKVAQNVYESLVERGTGYTKPILLREVT